MAYNPNIPMAIPSLNPLFPMTSRVMFRRFKPSVKQWERIPDEEKRLHWDPHRRKRRFFKNGNTKENSQLHHLGKYAHREKGPGINAPCPKGYRMKDWREIQAVAMKEAGVIVDTLIKKGKVSISEKDEFAREALTTAVMTMQAATSVKDKLAGAKLVLEYTMEKPVAKNEVTVQKAEDFLKALLEE